MAATCGRQASAAPQAHVDHLAQARDQLFAGRGFLWLADEFLVLRQLVGGKNVIEQGAVFERLLDCLERFESLQILFLHLLNVDDILVLFLDLQHDFRCIDIGRAIKVGARRANCGQQAKTD